MGKTTRPFRYGLNQILNDYRVEERNRLQGLDLIECLMNYGRRFVTLYRRQGSRPSRPKKNKCKKAKWLSGEAAVKGVKGREVKSKGEKEKRKEESCEIAVKGREVKSKGEKEDISI